MKKVFVGLLIVVCLAVLIVGLCVTCDCIIGSASAEAVPTDSVVRYNALAIDTPLSWSFNESNITSTRNLSSTYNLRSLLYVGASGNTVGSLYGNRLTSSIVSTGGNYVRLDFRIARSDLISLIQSYNSLYGTSISNLVCFTMNVNVVSSYYIGQVWGRNSLDGAANNTVALQASSIQGVRSLVLDLDTYNFNYYSFIVQTYGSIDILGLKVEVGDSFTGFVYDDFRVNGYDLGYSTGYNSGLTEGQDEVQQYLYSYREGAYYDYSSSFSYGSVDLVNGDSFGYPGSTVTGDGGLIYSSHFLYSGLKLYSSQLSTTWSINGYEWNNVNGSSFNNRYIIAVDLVNTGTSTTTLSVTFNGVTSNYILYSLDPKLLLYYSDSSSPSLSFSVSGTNSSVTFMKYKTEFSQFFTGFGNGNFDSASYDNGYQTGYIAGSLTSSTESYDLGFSDGSDQGFNSGFDSGYNDGFTHGYSTAYSEVGDGSNATWYSLFSSFIDVPIRSLIGFFDVNILGINFLSLFRTLILLSLFVYVIKVLVGKYA